MRLLIPLFLFAFAGLLADGAVTETIEATHPVSADASFSLDNVNGSVSIDTWDRQEIRVTAVKKAKSQEDLDAIEVQIQATDDHVGVKTKYNRKGDSFFDKWTNSGDVTYTVTVPRGCFPSPREDRERRRQGRRSRRRGRSLDRQRLDRHDRTAQRCQD